LCKNNHLEEALTAYHKSPDTAGASCLIAAHANKERNDLDTAFAVFDTLLTTSIRPNLFVFRSLLTACNKLQRPERALPVVNIILQHDIPLDDPPCFGALAKACCETGDVTTTQRLINIWRFSERSKRSTHSHKLFSVDAVNLIKAATKQRNLNAAFEVYNLICRDSKPNDHVFVALIDACLKCDQPDRALPLWTEMQRHKVSPFHNDVLLKCVSFLCAATGDLHIIQQILAKLHTSGSMTQPDSKTCMSLLKGLTKSGQLHAALKEFEWMKEHGLPVDSRQSYAVLATACADMVALQQDRQLHETGFS
jgi:pentatricopeptide repeat protein